MMRNLKALAPRENPGENRELVGTVHRVAANWMRDAVQRSEQRYRLLSELISAGVFHADASGIYRYVSDRWCAIAGLTSEEVRKKGWMSALHPADERWVIEEWYEALTEQRGFAAEYRLRHKNGRVVWVYGQTSPELEDREVVGYVGTLTDVSGQKVAKESLRLLNAALEQAPVAVAVLSAEEDARFVYANPVFSRMTGHSADELIGRPPRILYGPETDQDAVDRRQRLLATGESFTIELTSHRLDGTPFAAAWQLDPVRDRRGVTHWVAIVRELPA